MSTPAPEAQPTVTCPACQAHVPPSAFCGICGAALAAGAAAHRPHAYAAGAGEHVLSMSVVSSLFPHLPHRSRAAFRFGLLLLAAALLATALLRWQAPMVAVAAAGVPVLFVLYLTETAVYGDVHPAVPAATAAAAAVAGVGWALLAGSVSGSSASADLTGSPTAGHLLAAGLWVPLAGLVLMLAPVALCRVLHPGTAESLDGFVVGATAGLAFTVAATFTRLSGQLRAGVVAHGRPLRSIVIEALLQGVAVPLTAAALAGLLGATLWLRRRDSVHPWRAATRPEIILVLAAVVYIGLGLIDAGHLQDVAVLAVHAAVAVATILALRIGLHAALLHEQHDVQTGPPRLCQHCEHIVPGTPFCPQCGTAARVSPRSRRAALLVTATEGGTQPS